MEKKGSNITIKAEPQHDGEGNSAALLHHGVTPPADSYVFVLPKNSTPPASVTISFAGGHDGSNNKKDTCTCTDKNPTGLHVKIGPCGGGGGEARDMDVRGVTRIIQVVVHHDGAIIDSISVLYKRADGLEDRTELWGGRRGKRAEINLKDDENLTSVRGHCGKLNELFVIRSLTFVTNKRRFGPYGEEDGVPFVLPAAGGKIVGFHARSGDLLDALGTYVKMD